MPDRFLAALAARVLVADGATGTMSQSADLSLEDFDGLEGGNEILDVTRPDVVRDVRRGSLDAGVDAPSGRTSPSSTRFSTRPSKARSG